MSHQNSSTTEKDQNERKVWQPRRRLRGALRVDEVVVVVDGVAAVVLVAVLGLQIDQEIVVGCVKRTFLKFKQKKECKALQGNSQGLLTKDQKTSRVAF